MWIGYLAVYWVNRELPSSSFSRCLGREGSHRPRFHPDQFAPVLAEAEGEAGGEVAVVDADRLKEGQDGLAILQTLD